MRYEIGCVSVLGRQNDGKPVALRLSIHYISIISKIMSLVFIIRPKNTGNVNVLKSKRILAYLIRQSRIMCFYRSSLVKYINNMFLI